MRAFWRAVSFSASACSVADCDGEGDVRMSKRSSRSRLRSLGTSPAIAQPRGVASYAAVMRMEVPVGDPLADLPSSATGARVSGEVEDWHELGLIVPYFREVGFPQDPDYGRRPKKINAVLGLWDAPPHRDWLAWWTVGWTVLAGVAIATTPDDARTSSLPTWLDALLAAVVFGVLFGVFPAYLRLLVRRWRFRRARRTGHRSVSSEARESTANVLPRSEATPGPLSQPPVAAPTGPADAQPGSV